MRFRGLAALAAGLAAAASAGELSRRHELSLERALHGGPPRYTQDFVLADLAPDSRRRFSDFSGDLSGRFLGAAAAARGEGLEAARALGPRIFALQAPSGDCGPQVPKSGVGKEVMAKLWGHGRLLVGLLDYFRATGDPESLASARRLGDFLTTNADRFREPSVRRALYDGQGAIGYICWTQSIEGLAMLATATGEDRYRQAAAAIAETIEVHPGQHMHGTLTTLRGLLLLAESDAALLPRVEQQWQSLMESGNVLWNGGPPEYIDSLVGRDEGCASADWLRLNLALWRLTANERYLEAAEGALFNAFFANQLPGGDFGHLTFSAAGYAAEPVQAWWCCTLHGLRAFPEVRASAFRGAGDALYYDLPVDGRGAVGDFELEADADLATSGKISLRVLHAPATPVTLHVRKPARTSELRSGLGASRDAWLTLERIWEPGETVDIEYRFETVVDEADGTKILKRGPWILGLSEGDDPAYFNEGWRRHRIDWDSLESGDRPSRVTAKFSAPSFAGQTNPVTFRPLSERWETPESAMRWAARFEPEQVAAESRAMHALQLAYERRMPLAAGFALGALLVGAIAWLWRARAHRR